MRIAASVMRMKKVWEVKALIKVRTAMIERTLLLKHSKL